MKFRQVEF